ncbi:MAG: SDR family oxidoreductase [Saprospiraceae bacterium]|nr:SDR family oxidoreductase [Saprospiraceae bacterium]
MEKKIAIVTGAGKGIGRSIAIQLARDGYFIIIADLDGQAAREVVEIIGENQSCVYIGDISNETWVMHFYNEVYRIFGNIDVLVNNAGIVKDQLIWKMSVEEFDEVIRINLKGTWLMCREAAKQMKEQQNGKIINISSRAWMGNKGQTNYSASKAGVIGLTKALALELGPYNVFVNAVAPGFIKTPMTDRLSEEIREQLIGNQPIRRAGFPHEVANLVSFLASSTTQFITGQIFYIDGGKSIGAGY